MKPWKSNVRIGHGRHIQNIASPLIDLQTRSVLFAFNYLIQLKKANRCLGVGVLFMKLLLPCSHKIGQSVRRSERALTSLCRAIKRRTELNLSGMSSEPGTDKTNLQPDQKRNKERLTFQVFAIRDDNFFVLLALHRPFLLDDRPLRRRRKLLGLVVRWCPVNLGVRHHNCAKANIQPKVTDWL